MAETVRSTGVSKEKGYLYYLGKRWQRSGVQRWPVPVKAR